jgi:hypothetical protein
VTRLGLLLSLLLLAAGCGTSGASDSSTVAGSIRALENSGADFQLTVTEVGTGGDVPKGKYAEQVYASSGELRDDNAALVLGTKDSGTGMVTPVFDMVVNDSNIFVRPHGSTREWYTSWTFIAEEFIPGVRLNLVRETALLATKVSHNTNFSNGAFSNQFVITPAAEQRRQLMGFSSSGTLTAFLSTRGNRLQRIDGHFAGDDPSTKRHIVIDSSLVFTNLGHAAPPKIPSGGVAVQPADLFSTSLTGN